MDRIPTTIEARALWTLASLIGAARVQITNIWTWHASSDFVRVDVTGYPAERDEIIAAIGAPEPELWKGSNGGRYHDWRGDLLLMPVIVTEDLSREGEGEATVANDPAIAANQPAEIPATVDEPTAEAPGWFGKGSADIGRHKPDPELVRGYIRRLFPSAVGAR